MRLISDRQVLLSSPWTYHIFLVLETFHKYDGFIYPKSDGIFDRIFAPRPEVNDRRAFFRYFFPKWSGFHTDSYDDKIQPVEALQNLACLIENTIVVWTSNNGSSNRKDVDKSSLKIWEVGVARG